MKPTTVHEGAPAIDTKRCAKCGETKPLGEFYAKKTCRLGRSSICKACHKEDGDARRKANIKVYQARQNKWRSENPERIRRYGRTARLIRTHGITIAQFDAMHAAQGGQCAICGTTDPIGNGRKFHVDHCHASGKIRGLLCTRCNVGLGQFRDSPELLTKAVSYLLDRESIYSAPGSTGIAQQRQRKSVPG